MVKVLVSLCAYIMRKIPNTFLYQMNTARKTEYYINNTKQNLNALNAKYIINYNKYMSKLCYIVFQWLEYKQ